MWDKQSQERMVNYTSHIGSWVSVSCFGFRISNLSAKHSSVSLWLVKVYVGLWCLEYAEMKE
jgi:hypothetical protein